MKVLILGIDGYIGFPLALRLLDRGYEVYGADNFYTRNRVKNVGSKSAIKINSFATRNKKLNNAIKFYKGDVSNSKFVYDIIRDSKPDAIVHLAEQRSAPYSMISLKTATETLDKNIESTMNIMYAVKDLNRDIHIVKLGSMGEYGTPNIDIPEGFLNLSYNGRNDTLPFPRMGQSWYHLSKVFDTYNLMLANRIWNLNVSDVMQGVVYGTRTEEITKYKLFTRFDIDQVYGTVLNRFISQAVIGYPLTVYGKGDQKRAFLSLQDSVECLNLILDHPAEREYKVYNQFDEYYPLNYLAETVKSHYETIYGKSVSIDHVPNPRVEMEDHYYNPVNQNLRDIGYRRQRSLEEEMPVMISDVRKNINIVYSLKNVIKPSTNWR
ncbi:MAG: NAD-dependent epimerase/dehydratase family protein [Candidatus Thermoplasmatota archaeon]|jgi:nucleoside-diphosphate-sugar epimerase|uniref:NAD-dependent epimerase/dehydratase family protein n=1 Tax=Ferroplasma sp. TaxID=2591003 RepID=UPI002603E26F|nr:NAD-dependent epimerase/dehydratase family protein [Ferroplasma sp.]MCL4311037.1 NAD-dependent epimerase/dehydratase family protein [Candidatus Thermoplasmatota archaeon]